MADYATLQDAIDAFETNMTCLRNNSKNDDGTSTYATGIDWFKFNGVTVSNIYSSGNSWIGLGANTEQLKVNRRDTAVWYEFIETGTIGITRFLKFRWCGYAHYSSTANDQWLTYEWFLFENGQIFLNYRNVPTANFTNTNSINCGSQSLGFNTSAGTPCEYTFTPGDPINGTGWSIDSQRPQVDASYKPSGSAIYTITNYEVQGHDTLFYTAIVPEDTNLVVSVSVNNGNYIVLNSGDLIPGLPTIDTLVNLKVKLQLSTNNIYKTPKVQQVKFIGDKDKQIIVLKLNTPNVSSVIGNITINYDGLGGLRGLAGPCEAFNGNFTPSGLTWKGHQNDEEHIEISTSANINLIPIIYHSTKCDEHIEINMGANIILTDIHDI